MCDSGAREKYWLTDGGNSMGGGVSSLARRRKRVWARGSWRRNAARRWRGGRKVGREAGGGRLEAALGDARWWGRFPYCIQVAVGRCGQDAQLIKLELPPWLQGGASGQL